MSRLLPRVSMQRPLSMQKGDYMNFGKLVPAALLLAIVHKLLDRESDLR